jgi:hypothetical protein
MPLQNWKKNKKKEENHKFRKKGTHLHDNLRAREFTAIRTLAISAHNPIIVAKIFFFKSKKNRRKKLWFFLTSIAELLFGSQYIINGDEKCSCCSSAEGRRQKYRLILAEKRMEKRRPN